MFVSHRWLYGFYACIIFTLVCSCAFNAYIWLYCFIFFYVAFFKYDLYVPVVPYFPYICLHVLLSLCRYAFMYMLACIFLLYMLSFMSLSFPSSHTPHIKSICFHTHTCQRSGRSPFTLGCECLRLTSPIPAPLRLGIVVVCAQCSYILFHSLSYIGTIIELGIDVGHNGLLFSHICAILENLKWCFIVG